MSLIPSESYSFPDHFTRTVTYSNNPKKKAASVSEPELAPKKSFFFRGRNSSPQTHKKKAPRLAALPDPIEESFLEQAPVPEPRENFIAEEMAPLPPEEFLSVLPPPLVAPNEDFAPNGKVEAPQEPQENDVPPMPKPARPEPFIRKSPIPRGLKIKPRWNMRATPSVSVPTSSAPVNGEPRIVPVVEPAQPTIISMKPAILPPPEPSMPEPASSQVVDAPTLDLMQILFAHAAQAVPPPEPPKPAPVARARPVRRDVPRKVPRPPAPAPVGPTENREFDFACSTADIDEQPKKPRRSAKFRRFIFCESIAVGVLIPLAILGFSRVFTNSAVILLIDLFTIAAAVTAAVIPILFFAVAPTLPRDESGNRL